MLGPKLTKEEFFKIAKEHGNQVLIETTLYDNFEYVGFHYALTQSNQMIGHGHEDTGFYFKDKPSIHFSKSRRKFTKVDLTNY